ncbi:hypothetical protein MPDQ_007324 [Monascus purpureus]|uniref:Uncharacterized protein n=1 Tax=Monascus purpureus TaxID=5098 RepID=A0A507QSP1_MONPU|nr:hypothetical protein MPDQ_007324 [Monascus purpureus]
MTHHLPISSSLSPDKARSLGTEEKEIVKARSMRQVGTEPSAMGYRSINAQGLSAPSYFIAFLFALITTYVADGTQRHGLMLIATSLVALATSS